MIHEIKQVIWFDTPKGLALAKFLVDRGIDADNEWICIVNETGEIWSFDNSDILVCKSYTLNRRVEWNEKPKRQKLPKAISRPPRSMRRWIRSAKI